MKTLLTPFLASFGIFLLANLASYFWRSDGHGVQNGYDGVNAIGFPFLFYEEGGMVWRRYFHLVPCLKDLAIALSASAWVAWLLSRRRA